ncbi:MAG TPA: thiamine pyrophosphate-requiring protein [Stellaceae bacterium]|nr:thiamine pyrophosphate-requiring protein [Stellaceae bacterium]
MSKKTIAVESVAEAYLTLMAERGIEYFFANGGTDFAPIIEALAAINAKGTTPRLKVISVGHENVATSMAMSYYLHTGRPQLVMFHVNVGTANGINALIDAARDRVPIIFTAGRTPLTESGFKGSRDTGIHWQQEMFDQAGMVREFCKWDYELRNFEQLEAVVDRALEIATTEPCGPVYLSLPREVMAQSIASFSFEAQPRRGFGTMSGPTANQIERAADILARAERPLIIAQGAARLAASAPAIADFAREFAMPVVEFRTNVNVLSTEHPMLAGFVPGPLLKDADAVLCLEADTPWIPTQHGNPPEGCKVIQLGVEPLYQRIPIRSFPCDVAVTGSPALALPLIAKAMAGKTKPATIETRRTRIVAAREGGRAELRANVERASKDMPINPVWAAHCISEAKGDDAIVINEYSLILRYVQFKEARTCFGPPGAGGLGVGVGSAVGAKLANPDKTVIAVLGDGSYMFGNPTAGHYVLSALSLPVLFIIFNNGMWEEVEGSALRVFPDGQAARANRVPVAQLGPNPHYEHLMDVYGGYGERVDRPDQLPGALQRALHVVRVEKKQALINLIVGRRGAAP